MSNFMPENIMGQRGLIVDSQAARHRSDLKSVAADAGNQLAHKSILIVSRHDYRTKRRASVHFLAQSLVEAGHDVAFVSVGFSWLSRWRRDSRFILNDRANRWQAVDGLRAFLWRSPWHAAGIPQSIRQLDWVFDLWARSPCAALDKAAAGADIILVESGLPPVLIPRLRALAPAASLVYRAADLLDTAGVHPRVQAVLDESAAGIDLIVVVAEAMLPHFARFPGRKIVLPHGIAWDLIGVARSNPFADRTNNIVTMGSMLFDFRAVATAARALPDWHFHLIGTPPGSYPDNVRQHDEMPFEQTLAYLHHADVGLAAYQRQGAPDYLSASSLKLLQFGALGLPAVCPDFAVGGPGQRFGYDPDDLSSVAPAIIAAAGAPRIPASILSWSEVARRLMEAASE
jgi:2-beta-glucuronyltransferase